MHGALPGALEALLAKGVDGDEGAVERGHPEGGLDLLGARAGGEGEGESERERELGG